MVSSDPAWLDSMYNNRARVPEHPVHLARWASESADARAFLTCSLDLPYGDEPSETALHPAALRRRAAGSCARSRPWR